VLRIETYRISDLDKPNHQTHALSGNGHIRLRLTDISGSSLQTYQAEAHRHIRLRLTTYQDEAHSKA
jgi:hypothetical protein